MVDGRKPSTALEWFKAIGDVESGLGARGVAVGQTFYFWMGPHGERCGPSVPTVAARMRRSTQYVRDGRSDLVEAGWLIVKENASPFGGANLYVPMIPLAYRSPKERQADVESGPHTPHRAFPVAVSVEAVRPVAVPVEAVRGVESIVAEPVVVAPDTRAIAEWCAAPERSASPDEFLAELAATWGEHVKGREYRWEIEWNEACQERRLSEAG